MVFTHRDTAYGLTIIWALVAVYEQTPSPLVKNTAVAALAVVGVVSLLSVLRRRPEAGGGASLVSAPLLGGSTGHVGIAVGASSSVSADVEARQPLRQQTESDSREEAP